MTGQELFEGWCKAFRTAAGVPVITMSWSTLGEGPKQLYEEAAEHFSAYKIVEPPFDTWLDYWAKRGVTYNTTGLAGIKELLANWFGYFPQQTTSSAESSMGDVWVFKASGLRATVLDVSGSKVKLRLHGQETDWMEESELATSAKRETK